MTDDPIPIIDGTPLVTSHNETGACINCGHDYGANGLTRCPECGRSGCDNCMPEAETAPCPECRDDQDDANSIDHPVLDLIDDTLANRPGFLAVSREHDPDRVEFIDADTGRRYEVVVREIEDEQDSRADSTPATARSTTTTIPWCGRCECYHFYGNCV